MPLPLLMLMVFGAAKLLAELFESLSLPGIAGEIVAGAIIGPSILGWVKPDGVVLDLADLGVIFLLFRVGLEIKSSELAKIGGRAALVAAGGVVLSFSLVWGVLALWGIHSIEAIFISAATAATSAGITAEVLSERGLLDRRASRIVLAAAVIDDVCGLLVLSVVSGLTNGKLNIVAITSTVMFAVLFIVLVATWGTKALQRLLPRIGKGMRAAEAEFALSMLILFGLSLVSVYAGVAAIVGAFLAGMALSETVGRRVQTLVQGAAELLVPFFLVAIGLRVNTAAFHSPALLGLAAVLLVAAVLGKLGGCGLGALGLGIRDAMRVGAGMSPRGEVTMVVAQVALTMGVIRQDMFGVIVLVAVVSALLAPVLIGAAFRERVAARVA
jgi:Kef-type K+ transport system membrane component KefB